MSFIQENANLVAGGLEKRNIEKRVAFDPAILYIIVQIIVALVELYNKCNQTPKQAHASMKSLNILERWYLRRVIRKHIDDTEMQDYIGGKMFDSFAELGATVTEEEVVKIFEEAQTK